MIVAGSVSSDSVVPSIEDRKLEEDLLVTGNVMTLIREETSILAASRPWVVDRAPSLRRKLRKLKLLNEVTAGGQTRGQIRHANDSVSVI